MREPDKNKNSHIPESLRILMKRWKDGTFGEILDDWRWIFGYSLRYKGAITIYLILGLVSSTLSIFSAWINAQLVDMITKRQVEKLPLLILISVGSMLFSLIFSNLVNRLTTRMSIDINNAVQADIFDKIIDADWLAMNKYSNGDILNRFNSDINTVANNAISWLPSVILAMYSFFATLFVMWHMDHMMAVLAFLTAPLTLLASRIVIRKQREYGKKVRQMTSQMMAFEVETIYNFDSIKSFGIAPLYSRKLRRWQDKYKDMSLEYNMFSIKTNIYMSVVGYAVTSLCFFYCLFRLWTNQITYGKMTFFLTQQSNLSSSFSNVVAVVPNFLNSSISAHRIRELTELPREVHIPKSGELDRLAGQGFSVAMEDLTFSYVENKHVITKSEFLAQPGEIVALVGPSGEGKTTMIRLILGLVHGEEGRTFIKAADGTMVEMNADTRHLFSYVPQGNTILSGTIAENLCAVKEDATEEEMIRALKMSCAWDFVKELPETLHSSIGERGRGLSEGQAQRIAIARAILRDAPILLLDEATSALDVTTERQVLRNIIQQQPNKTIIVTTHRPSVLNMCRRVYRVMETQVTELTEEESAKMAMDF